MALFNKPDDLEPLIIPNPKRFPNLSLAGKGKPAAIIALGIIVLILIYYIATALIPDAIDNLMEQDADCVAIPVHVDTNCPNDEEFGGSSVKEALTDGDKTYLLMPTFDNKAAAMLKASEYAWECGPITFLLTNPITWQEGVKSIYTFGIRKVNDKCSIRLQQFADTYENNESNRELKRTAYTQGLDAVTNGLVEYTGQDVYDPYPDTDE